MEPHSARALCCQRPYVLAPFQSMDRCRCVATAVAGDSQQAWTKGRSRSEAGRDRQRVGACSFWGIHTGPNPTDRGKNGCKRHIVTDAAGTPVTLGTSAANLNDGETAIELLDAIPAIQGPRGRPRFRPDELVGDRAYGWSENIRETRERGVKPVLARPQDTTHGSGLGKIRWVVERTLSWFNNFRRLRACYERTSGHFYAFHQLAATLICYRRLLALLF